MVLVEAAALKKNFGGLQAVQSFDFRMNNGEIVGLIGPNGSGKTTIFNVVTGIFPASGGSISFDDGRHELVGRPSHVITALGIARTFQNQRLFNQMTVLENVLVGRHCRTRAGLTGILLALPKARAEKRRVQAEAAELLPLFAYGLGPAPDTLARSRSYA